MTSGIIMSNAAVAHYALMNEGKLPNSTGLVMLAHEQEEVRNIKPLGSWA